MKGSANRASQRNGFSLVSLRKGHQRTRPMTIILKSTSPSTSKARTSKTPKRPCSPAKLAANQRNAQKNTGPRSPEAKAVTRLNGVTHAMTCKLPVVLAHEDPAAFQAELALWTRH